MLVFALLSGLSFVLAPVNSGQAQGVEEIYDPELGGDEGESAFDSSEGVDVIEDPELADAPPPPPPPLALPSEVHAIVHTRLGHDLVNDNPYEETWESQSMIQLEAKLRTDQDTRFALGARFRYWATSMEASTVDSDPMRFAMDLLPVSAYLDHTLTEGLHVRLGYQNVQLGRFDALSSTDVLSVSDLRDGPMTLPDAARVGQLAARIDADLSSAIGLQLIWVPFFSPHILQVAEGDYSFQRALAVAAARDPALGQFVNDLKTAVFGTAFTEADFMSQQAALAEFRSLLTRGARARGLQSGLDVFAPDPDITSSQVALRAVAHGASGEVAFTAATALEKLPALRIDVMPATASEDPAGQMDATFTASVKYPRFYVLALDGATDVGPVQVGAELSLGMRRSFYYFDSVAQQPIWQRGEIVQGSLRAEYLQGTALIVAVEANVGGVLAVPEAALEGFSGLHGGRYQFGLAGLVRYAPGPFGAEVGGALITGTTYFVAPRVFYELVDGLEAELGAQLFGQIADTVVGQSIGDAFEDIDQAFIGLRWIPHF